MQTQFWTLKIFFIASGALTGSLALGWGDLGHGAVGYIAEKNLSPEGRAFVNEILGPEPLGVAAVYADQVRSDSRYKDFAPYHFLEVRDGFTYDSIPAHDRVAHDANVIITQVPRHLLERNLNRDQKAILLKYLIHVVGDVHQPLHVGNGRDEGGNLCEVKWKDPLSRRVLKVSLHSVWDDHLIRNLQFNAQGPLPNGAKKAYFSYKSLGDLILEHPKLSFRDLGEGGPLQWYAESRALHSIAYPPAVRAKKGGAKRPLCKALHSSEPIADQDIPYLGKAYIDQALPVVKERILLGGYRLARLLNDLAKEAKSPPLDPVFQQKEIDALLFSNEGL